MRRFFSSLKDKLIGGSEGSEAAGAEVNENSETLEVSEEALMTSASEGEEGAAATAVVAHEVSEMERLEPDDMEEVPVSTPADESCGNPPRLDDSETKEPTKDVTSISNEDGELSADAGARRPTVLPQAANRSSGGDLVSINIADQQLSLPAIANAITTGVASTINADLQTNTSSESSDIISWEPKAKDVKMALTEKGDNNAIITKKDPGKRSFTKPEVIHPLQNSWGIWCFMQDRCQDWHENVRHISNFSSVEDFWSLFNHIQTVDNLPIGCDYYIFKANIQPMWEDRANINGGRWLLKIPQSHPNFVHLWIETLLLLVGEAFETESESICGAVAQVRRGINKISIWTREASDRNACMRIGYRWKKSIKVAAPIHYEAHMEVNRKGGRRSKSVYSIS